MFEQILKAKGCVNVKKSPDVIEFPNNLDDNSKRFIESFGGFRVFLMKCTPVFFHNRNPNVVYYETCDLLERPFLDENLNPDMSSLISQTFLDESLSEDSNDIEGENSFTLKENIGKESVIQEEKIDEKASIETLDADSAEKEPTKNRLPKHRGTDVDKVCKDLRKIAEKSEIAEVLDSDEEGRTRPRPSKTYGLETRDGPSRVLLSEYIKKHTKMQRKNNSDAQNQQFLFTNKSSIESAEGKSSVSQALQELKELEKRKSRERSVKSKEKKMKRFVKSSRDKKEGKTSKSNNLNKKSVIKKESSDSKWVIESPEEVKISKLGESIEKRSSVTQATSAKIANEASSEKSAKQKEQNTKAIVESQSVETVTVSKLEESVKKKSNITPANSANNDTILGSMQQLTKGTGKSKLLEKQATITQNKMKLAADNSLSEEKCLKVFLSSESSNTRSKISDNEKEGGSVQKSSKVKQQKQSAVVNQENHIKDTTVDDLPLSVVEVGIQVDTYKEEREDYIHKSDVLMSTNKKLIEEVKQGKMYQVKYEDAMLEMQIQNVEFITATTQYKKDIKELKAIIEVIILRE